MFTKKQLTEASKQARKGFHLPYGWSRPEFFIRAMESASRAGESRVTQFASAEIRKLLGRYKVRTKEVKDD